MTAAAFVLTFCRVYASHSCFTQSDCKHAVTSMRKHYTLSVTLAALQETYANQGTPLLPPMDKPDARALVSRRPIAMTIQHSC